MRACVHACVCMRAYAHTHTRMHAHTTHTQHMCVCAVAAVQLALFAPKEALLPYYSVLIIIMSW